MKKLLALLLLSSALPTLAQQPTTQGYPDKFVWLFGWDLRSDAGLQEMTKVIEQASKSGLNSVVASLGLDTLCKQPPEYFERLAAFKAACKSNRLEFIPAIFSIGYGGGALSHDRNLAEGLPVRDASFVVKNGVAALDENTAVFTNGDFEVFNGNKVYGFQLQDEPGRSSFIDTNVVHTGKASLRLENFKAHPAGNARIMQTIKVRPHRSYRVSFWVKGEELKPGLRTTVLAGGRDLAPREFNARGTFDWRRVSYVFNSMGNESVSAYAGVWSGNSGKVWIDSMAVTEVGPVNVLRRPGAPVQVRSEDGATTYEEGKDYARLQPDAPQPFRDDHEALPLKVISGGKIKEGQRLKVSWYHSMLVHDSQVTVCMAEPVLDEIFDHEARLLAERVKPSAVLLNMDEVRMGVTCKACEGRNMAELLGNCVAKQARAIRKYSPGARIYVWSDMFDPSHNARPNYYLVEGDYTGSWNYLPKDVIVAVWGGEPRPESLRFFAQHKFETLIGCYYDAENLDEVKGWLRLAKDTKGVRGFMYTPWLRKYELLPEFGKLLQAAPTDAR